MQHPNQINEGRYPTYKKDATTTMKSLMEALEQDPLNVRFYLPALTELSKRSSIEELDSLLPELQRSLREQALYQSSGYDESVRRYVKQLTTLFSAVLADSSGQTH